MSNGIKVAQWATGHKYWWLTHVALLVDITEEMANRINLVLIDKDLGYQIEPGLHVFESTTMNKWANKKGVQINPYKDWLKNYNGKVYTRPVTAPDSLVSGLTDCICEYVGVPYESGIPGLVELARCVLPRWLITKPTLNLHCTETDGRILQELVLMKQFPPEKMPPCMWMKEIDKLMLTEVGDAERLK